MYNNNFNRKPLSGPRKVNYFDILSLLGGHSLTHIFEIKSKKKELAMPSPFPKKKTNFKITSSGSIKPYYFFSKEGITVVFDCILEEMTKF